MKNLKTILLFAVISLNLNAQQVSYKVSEDEPKKVTNFSLNIDVLHLDCGFYNIDGTSFNTGLWGHAMFKERFGVDYSFRYGWLTFIKSVNKGKGLASNTNLQLGGFYVFQQRVKATDNKVILKSESAGTTRDGRSITKTTFINVPSSKWNYTAVRGGLYFKRSPVNVENDLGPDLLTNYYMLGAYGGICFGRAAKVQIQTDNFGQKGRAFHTRLCLDALITPINNVPTNAKATLPIGGRLLWQSLPVVSGRKNRRAYKVGMTTEIEIGYRMVDGPYVAGGIAIPISRTLKALSVDGSDGSKTRTAE